MIGFSGIGNDSMSLIELIVTEGMPRMMMHSDITMSPILFQLPVSSRVMICGQRVRRFALRFFEDRDRIELSGEGSHVYQLGVGDRGIVFAIAEEQL